MQRNFSKTWLWAIWRAATITLLVSPSNLKQIILLLIGEETARGSYGRIIMKMNSLTDYDVMEKLAEASRAGVRVDLIIRGICCLRPGVPGHTEHISVTSIGGALLEHSRIYSFGSGENQHSSWVRRT